MTTAISFPPALDETTLQELDDLLAALRETHEEVPQWEFCDGFLTAVACTRRPIGVHEWLPMLLGDGEPLPAHAPLPQLPVFGTEAQQTRFLELAQARLAEILRQLDRPTHSLEEDDAFSPEVLDTRGAVLMMSAEEQAEIGDEPIPSLAQVWALGFMFAVENWPEDWELPRDKEVAGWLDDALDCIVALTEDDTGKPEVSMYSEDGEPSTSNARVEAFGAAIWAVYDLRQLWKSLGPRIESVRKAPEPGRNDPCTCGSGKKYKKCCGA